MSKPTVGRIIHAVDRHNGECMAAMVTSSNPNDDYIHVSIFTNSGGVYPLVLHGTRDEGKYWHWPEHE